MNEMTPEEIRRNLVALGVPVENINAVVADAEAPKPVLPGEMRKRLAEESRAFELRKMTAWCRSHGLPTPVPEYQFWPGRRFAFDWAWPDLKVALEQDGAVHRLKERFDPDIGKMNEAQLRGWIVLRARPSTLYTALTADLLWRAIRSRK